MGESEGREGGKREGKVVREGHRANIYLSGKLLLWLGVAHEGRSWTTYPGLFESLVLPCQLHVVWDRFYIRRNVPFLVKISRYFLLSFHLRLRSLVLYSELVPSNLSMIF